VTLKIPRPLYEQLKQVIQGSGFHSVTEFAVYVLRDLVSHRSEAARYGLRPEPEAVEPEGVEPQAAAPEGVDPEPAAPHEDQEDIEPLSPDEIEAVRKRLTSLGYL
jgi:hypothetical protein